jgi:hypothetical protein
LLSYAARNERTNVMVTVNTAPSRFNASIGGASVRTTGGPAETEQSWKELDARKPDSNKPMMESQRSWLSDEAKKLGKSVTELSREDIVNLASKPGTPGPSEISRIRENMTNLIWRQLDQQKPDPNKPMMESQRGWLSDEAKKLGKSVTELSREDIVNLASRPGTPGPSEISRIRENMTNLIWHQLDQQKPDPNKPMMESQRGWLSDEAKKLGKSVSELSREDIVNLASKPGTPGPSEIARFRDNMVGQHTGDTFGSGPSAGQWRPAPAGAPGGSPLETRLGALLPVCAR